MAEIIQKQYTYKLPDTYYGSTSEEGKTASAMYEGFDIGYVYIEKETGRLCVDEGFTAQNFDDSLYTLEEFEQELRIAGGVPRTLVKLNVADSADDTLIAAIITGQNIADWPTVEYAFPAGHPNAGEVYNVDVDPLPVNDVLDYDKIFYDVETSSWKIDEIPFVKPHCTEEAFWAARDRQVEYASSLKESQVWTAEQEAALDDFISVMNGLDEKYAGIHHMMISFPEFPDAILYPAPEPEVEPAAEEEPA